MERFYTIDDFADDFFTRNSRRMRFTGTTEEELVDWQKKARAVLADNMGLTLLGDYFAAKHFNTFESSIAESVAKDGYTREKIFLRVERDIVIPLYLFKPVNIDPGKKYPVILAPHGHGGGGKVCTAGIRDSEAVALSIDRHNYDYGEKFAKKGCIVLCPDAAGFGDRREPHMQDENALLSSSCEVLNHMLIPLGLSIQAVWTHNLMRLADYALSMEYSDPERLYCAGLSGGGLQTLFFAACDERVKKAVISGYFYGVRQSLLHMPLNCSCNFSYRLWYNFDMGDLACLIFPRAFLVETGDQDPLNGADGVENVRSQVEVARRAYAVAGLEDRIEHHIYDGQHRWYGADTDSFLGIG